MKKLIISFSLLISINIFAHMPLFNVDTQSSEGLIKNVDFAPMQIGVGFFENAQLYDGEIPSFISIGLLGLLQQGSVISFAPINGMKNNYGIHCGLFAGTEKNYFLSTSIFNASKCNYALQLGLGNIAEYSTLQIGAVNFNSTMQIGAYNLFGKFQCGIFNVNGNLQIGLLNYNKNALIKWMPLFNFSSANENQK